MTARDHLARAKRFLEQGELHRAEQELARCLAASPTPAERCQALLLLATDVLRARGQLRASHGRYREALAAARTAGDPKLEVRAAVGLATIAMQIGELREATDELENALVLARSQNDASLEGIVLGNLGSLHFNVGRLDAALESYGRSLEVDRRVGDRIGEAIDLGNMAMVRYVAGDVATAEREYGLAFDIVRAADGPADLGAHLRIQLGTVLGACGEVARARVMLEEALVAARSPSLQAFARAGLARLAILEGDLGRARTLLEDAVRVTRASQDRLVLGHLLCDVAMLERRAGQAGAAGRATDEASAIAAELGHGRLQAQCLLESGLAALALGRPRSGREAIEKAAQVLEGTPDAHLGATVSAALADARSRCNDTDPAALDRAEAAFAALADPIGSAWVRRIRAEQDARGGGVERAAAILAETAEQLRSRGLRLDEAETLLALGRVLAAGGDGGTAVAALERAESLARAAGAVRIVAEALRRRSRLCRVRGDLAAARGLAESSVTALQRTECGTDLAASLVELATILEAVGEPGTEARARAEGALADVEPDVAQRIRDGREP